MYRTIHNFTLFTFVTLICLVSSFSAIAQLQAITGTVYGERIQNVGFRAMIQREAISYNLSGDAHNNTGGTVSFRLQGDKERIAKTVEAMRAGTKNSSKDNVVDEAPATLDPNLKTFTVFGWTSQSREISTPYDLVFALRNPDSEISKKEAKAVWNNIAERTLKGDDLSKFMRHLEEDEEDQ